MYQTKNGLWLSRIWSCMREDAQQRHHALRELFNGLRYVIRYGIAWRAMPNDLPPWSAVYQQSRRWMEAGCFDALVSDLRAVLRIASGRRAEPTAAILDSRTLRSTPDMTGPSAKRDQSCPWPMSIRDIPARNLPGQHGPSTTLAENLE